MGFTAILDDNESFIERFKPSLMFEKYPDLFEEEFTKLILDITINARVLDDLIMNSEKGISLKNFENVELIGILDEKEFSSPREALNKIIHSTYLGHDIRSDDNKPYYMPSLQLLGNKGKNEWIAEIYLLPFCKVLYDFANENEKLNE
ncbi:hypothetical protein [Tenacibaculum discolor]|uniref:hypothetical protein n=1 Tax=Tenacibaculum discolor TaxID=361581 RepID=UPI000F5931AF|nr:hypothetical protein [Tenacibaculum discolor]